VSSGTWRTSRGTNIVDSGAPFYDTYETADGRWLAVGAMEAHFYADLLEVLGLDPASLPDQDDQAQWPRLKQVFADAVRTRTRDEWVARAAGRACISAVLEPQEAWADPHNVARGTFVELAGVTQPSPQPRFSRTPAVVDAPPPVPGEHTRSALTSWGGRRRHDRGMAALWSRDRTGARRPMKSLERSYETLLLEEVRPGVVVVTLNRPDRYNAMTNTMFAELERMALDLGAEDDCRVLVLTGAGRSFCAGYDLADAEHLSSLGAIGMLDQQERAARALLAVRSTRMPVIAAVNGPAAGGGLALALQADIRLGSPEAKFNAAFVRIGLSAGDLGTSWLLTRLVGPAVTSDIAFTGRMVYAAEAERIGLVNAVSEPGKLLEDTLELAASIVANSPGGVQLSKRALQANMEIGSYAAAIELENRGQALLTRSSDMPEALAAFKEKRRPVFRGE
jgi:enoyl-CoA hydratase/carnithine racemase